MTSNAATASDVSEAEVIELTPESTDKLDQVSKLIANAAKWSVGAALIPVPNIDVLVIAGIQANLVNDIAKVYGSAFSKEKLRSLITVLTGTLAPAIGASVVVGSTAKLFPGYGSLFGFVSMSAFSVAATYAIGKVMVKHFEGGGTADNFDAEAVKADLKEEFKKAVKK